VNDRVFCEHAHVCAGCPLIDWTYGAQLEAKRARVERAAALYPTLASLAIDRTAAAEPNTRYRVRAKLMVGAPPDNAPPSIGLFARAGAGPEDHRVVDIPSCRVLTPSLEHVTSELRKLLAAPPSAAGGCLVAEARGGLLSAFDLREVVDDEAAVLVTLVLAAKPAARESELESAARAVRELSPAIAGVAVNYREPRAVQVLGATTRSLWGADLARDRLGDTYRLATYGSFTQAHRGQAARIEEWIASRVGPSETRVLDLYGGSGALSLPLARRGARVTLIESFGPAAACAERAAREQAIDGFAVRTGDAATIAGELAKSGARFDVVITNPPRRGMPPTVKSALAALAPRWIAYVSCDPDTLCRDLDHLARLGYRAESLRPLDMIPLTDQVETVAFLRPEARPAPRFAFEDDDVFVADRHAHDPALRGASGLVVGCKTPALEERLRASLAAANASRTELVLCRGVTAKEGRVGRRTQYRRLARAAGHSVLRVKVRGDREARVERDLARIGHPVVGDARNGHAPTNRHFEERYALDRPFLHCMKVEFDHPRTGARIVVEGALPGELAMVLGRLGLVALEVAKEVMVG
jgi:23S rRNA (uracil1939-C5)-methyltransferase